jgi:N-acetylmuramoyl-L-alanine amidase
MTFQTGVLEAVNDWGLTVVEHDGWATRGGEEFDPRGHVLHHDAVGPTDTVPEMIVDGREDLPGPLTNFWISRSGVVHVVAAGRAHHAGEGGFAGLEGGRSVWGSHLNNRGTEGDPWPDAQLEAMARLAAATADYSGFEASKVCGHKEWTDRKVDPHTIDMADFRDQVAAQARAAGA